MTADQVRAGGGAPQALDVSSGIAYTTGFNLNGIVAKDARRLIVVQTNTGKLFRIRLESGGSAIDDIDEVAGVSLPGGDGLLLDRGRLVAVQRGPRRSFRSSTCWAECSAVGCATRCAATCFAGRRRSTARATCTSS